MRQEFRTNLGKVQEEQKRMGTALVKAMDASFTIEDSPYKVQSYICTIALNIAHAGASKY